MNNLSNTKTDFLKLIAILTMIIDHVGAVFYPQEMVFRAIGRIAFPIFAYHIAVGYKYTSNLLSYGIRLFVFGLISQIPYSLVFDTQTLNIFFTLLLGLIAISIFDRVNRGLGLLVPLLALIINIDYGVYGGYVILLFFIYANQRTKLITGQSFLNLIYCIGHNYFLQMYSLLALVLIFLPPIKFRLNISRFWFYGFYPGHLILFLLIKALVD